MVGKDKASICNNRFLPFSFVMLYKSFGRVFLKVKKTLCLVHNLELFVDKDFEPELKRKKLLCHFDIKKYYNY